MKNTLLNLFTNSKHVNALFVISFLLAITLRVNFEISHPHISGDYAYTALPARNFIEGHGFTVAKANLQNISSPVYLPFFVWANGFSILLVALYYIAGNFINALILAQVIGIILLIFGVIRIFKLLGLSKFTQSLFLLFTAFAASPYSYLGTTDTFTAALFLWAMALSIEICTQETKNIWREIAIGLLLFISATFRYACIPNILIIPSFFVLFSMVTKKWKPFFSGIKILLYAVIPTFIFFSIYRIFYDKSQDVSQFHFTWGVLKLFDAFPLKAFFYTAPLDFRVPDNRLICALVRLLEYIGSLIISSYLFWYLLKKRNWWKGLKEKNNIDLFTTLSIIAFLVTIGFLLFLSLTTSPLKLNFSFHSITIWAYIYETRYFVISILLIQVFFFTLMDKVLQRTLNLKYVSTFVIVLFISSLFVNIGYSSYAIYQSHTINSYSYWHKEKDLITMHKLLNMDALHNPDRNIVLATCWKRDDLSDPFVYSLATNVIYQYQYDSIIQEKFQHTKPVILYVVLPVKNLTEQETKFISDFNARKVIELDQQTQHDTVALYRAYLQ